MGGETEIAKSSGRKKFSLEGAYPTKMRMPILGRYDVANRTEENASLWANVDSLSAAAANSPHIRRIIRDRARYETANNSFACGIVTTFANDTIGPEAQIQMGCSELAQKAEKSFCAWAREIGLFKKTRLAIKAKKVDGEVFGLLFTNRKLNHQIKLDVQLLECDMVESWYSNLHREDEIDGIRFDEVGNVTHYRVLDHHPGDHRGFPSQSGKWVKEKFILHYFTPTRPGQVRGVSELVSSLSLFGQLRRYTSAVLETATRAAEISGIMYTDQLPEGAAELTDPVTIMDVERNSIMSLPEGWKLTQLKSEQPTTVFKDFRSEIIGEAARPFGMPFNVASCNSSGYNYSSGRLDYQAYDKSIEVERADCKEDWLDKIVAAWLEEYAAREGLTPEEHEELLWHVWYFSGRDYIDPQKEASADDIRFGNRSLTKESFYAKRGKDWVRESKQIIMEMLTEEEMWIEERKKRKLPPAPFPGTPVDRSTQNTPSSTKKPGDGDDGGGKEGEDSE